MRQFLRSTVSELMLTISTNSGRPEIGWGMNSFSTKVRNSYRTPKTTESWLLEMFMSPSVFNETRIVWYPDSNGPISNSNSTVSNSAIFPGNSLV